MSTENPRDPRGISPSHDVANREESSNDKNLDWSTWRPQLDGPHYQPTGGPNGTPIIMAIGTPGRIRRKSEEDLWAEYYREMQDASQVVIPDEGDDDEAPGSPHADPVEGTTTNNLRRLGTTETGWEVWYKNGRSYCYDRASNTTKYSWSTAEIESDEQRHAQTSAARTLPIRSLNDEGDPSAPGSQPRTETETRKVADPEQMLV